MKGSRSQKIQNKHYSLVRTILRVWKKSGVKLCITSSKGRLQQGGSGCAPALSQRGRGGKICPFERRHLGTLYVLYLQQILPELRSNLRIERTVVTSPSNNSLQTLTKIFRIQLVRLSTFGYDVLFFDPSRPAPSAIAHFTGFLGFFFTWLSHVNLPQITVKTQKMWT